MNQNLNSTTIKNNLENNKFPDNMMIFLHIPKTAGTSFLLTLEKKIKVAYDYGKNSNKTSDFIKETFYQHKNVEFIETIINNNYQCIAGHFEASQYQKFYNCQTKLITFLRNPIQRCISAYFHMCRHYGYDQTIEVFANQNLNGQSRFLSDLSLDSVFFGITENYEDSIKLLNKQLNLNLELITININQEKGLQNTYKCHPSLSKLFEINTLDDLKLYQTAQNIFEKSLIKEEFKTPTFKINSSDSNDQCKFYENDDLMLTSFDSCIRCAEFLKSKKQFREAYVAYAKAIEIDSNSPNVLYNMGLCLKAQKQFEQATKYFQQAIELEPESYDYYHHFGDALFEQQYYTEAVAMYEKVIKLNPNFAWSYYNQGRAFLNQSMTEEAISAFRKALSVEPDFVQCQKSLKQLLTLQNET
ncbi:MAG: tetratricopeptide repeat protein [Waterburya sp.]